METKMKNLLFIVSVSIAVVSCNSNHVVENVKSIRIDNNKFEFELPKASKEIGGDLRKALLQANSNILYYAICDTSGSKYMFSVSKYVAENEMTIEEAFMISVETTTNINTDSLTDNFQLIDYKEYIVQGKTLRYKISEHFNKVNAIMYYFMKDNYSNELYEIKISTKKSELTKSLNFMEEVALSVRIK